VYLPLAHAVAASLIPTAAQETAVVMMMIYYSSPGHTIFCSMEFTRVNLAEGRLRNLCEKHAEGSYSSVYIVIESICAAAPPSKRAIDTQYSQFAPLCQSAGLGLRRHQNSE
jgi:hypothetical protein